MTNNDFIEAVKEEREQQKEYLKKLPNESVGLLLIKAVGDACQQAVFEDTYFTVPEFLIQAAVLCMAWAEREGLE